MQLVVMQLGRLYVTGALLFIKVQRGKEGMKDSRYQQELGATAACTKWMMEETKGIDRSEV